MWRAYRCGVVLVSVLVLTGCDKSGVDTGKSTISEMEATEKNHQRMVAAVPPPQLTDSLERRNLVARLQLLNKSGMIGYCYLLNRNGGVVAFYTTKGKVSSLNSLLTTDKQVVAIPHRVGGVSYHELPSPDFDGSYGKNPEGIFGFTSDGTYFEWSGDYLFSDRPLHINTPVILTSTVDLEKKGK